MLLLKKICFKAKCHISINICVKIWAGTLNNNLSIIGATVYSNTCGDDCALKITIFIFFEKEFKRLLLIRSKKIEQDISLYHL